MDDDLLTALYHAASSEEPDTMDGPSLCDYYRRRNETEHTRRALVDTVGGRCGRGQLRGGYGVPGVYKRLPAGPGAVQVKERGCPHGRPLFLWIGLRVGKGCPRRSLRSCPPLRKKGGPF